MFLPFLWESVLFLPFHWESVLFFFPARVVRIWWPRKISNKELWRQTGQCPIEQEIRQRAWGWIGHTLRRPDKHVVKRALEWNPKEKRKRGRSQHTWRRTRMVELESKHLTWNEIKGTAQNRVRWRSLVEDLCSTSNEQE